MWKEVLFQDNPFNNSICQIDGSELTRLNSSGEAGTPAWGCISAATSASSKEEGESSFHFHNVDHLGNVGAAFQVPGIL
jgi:hypothetical protein